MTRGVVIRRNGRAVLNAALLAATAEALADQDHRADAEAGMPRRSTDVMAGAPVGRATWAAPAPAPASPDPCPSHMADES